MWIFRTFYEKDKIVNRARRKRIFTSILAAILVWNSVQIPGSIPQVSAHESNVEENGKTVSNNSIEVSTEELSVVTVSNNALVAEKIIEEEEATQTEEATEEEATEEEEATQTEEAIETDETTQIEETIETEENTTEDEGMITEIEEENSEMEETSSIESTEEVSTETIELENAEEEEDSVENEECSTEVEEDSAEESAETEETPVSVYNRSENAISLSEDIWVEGFEKESLCYTGEAVKQNLQIYHNDILLKEGKDYILQYRNNVNVGEADLPNAPAVRIAMIGQYSGSQTLYYSIAPRDIGQDCEYEAEHIIYYKKRITVSVPKIVFGGRELKYKKDYECDYSTLPKEYKYGDSYEDGMEYEYTVTGKGNFTGSYVVKLRVLRDKSLDFQNAKVSLDKEQYEYRGEALTNLDVQILSLVAGKTELSSDWYEYRVYADEPGTGYIEVYPSEAGKAAGYVGCKKIEFEVVGDRDITEAVPGTGWQESIVFSKKQLDENGGICQAKNNVLIYGENAESLTEGVDYIVTYYNHRKVGQAKVVFSGIGRYTGTIQKTYEITGNAQLDINWKERDTNGNPIAVYTKGGVQPQFEVVENAGSEEAYILQEKTDYTVKLSNNKKVGMMTCEIIGKGNFKDYSSVTEVEIVCGDLSAGIMSVQDKVYSEKENAWKASVSVTDSNGNKLKAGIDYDKNLIYNYEGMEEGNVPVIGTTVYVTANGIQNFEGSAITAEYRICGKKINKLIAEIDPQEYTGQEIELTSNDIHLYDSWSDYYNGIELDESCYSIAGYNNNVKTGKAKVILRGMGEYGGEKTCTFKIVKKKYEYAKVTEVALDETEVLLGVDKQKKLTASVLPEDADNKTILWMSSDRRVATVDKNGLVTAKKPGKVNILAYSQDTGKKASCKVTVEIIPVTSFELETEKITGFEGTGVRLEATNLQPADGTYATIGWESSNPEIASVDENGNVSLHRAGMAVIKAYSADRQFVKKCMVFVEKEGEVKPEGNYLTPQMFRTSNETDDTKAFNRAIQNLGNGCDTVYVPAGTYYINAEVSIILKSNTNLILSDEAIIQALGNSKDHSDVILVRDVSGVNITGGNIIGERYQHKASEGEWGMGIGIYDSSNVHVDGVSVSNCWGDGIYIGSKHDKDLDAGSAEIRISNSYLFNNRRNNMSIVCADYVTVDNCRFEYANGTSPQYGIDIETNNANNPCEHITISNSTFKGNGVAAMGIVTAANDIMIVGCIMNGAFINYAGTNVKLSNTTINGEMCARIGVDMLDGSVVNDGSDEEDVLVAKFAAGTGSYTLGEYGIDGTNQMSAAIVDDEDSATGKTLQLKRLITGNQESGYYLDLSELTGGLMSSLKAGATYRFEYSIKGSGFWGVKTNQTGWYPMVLSQERYTTGFTVYKAKAASSCQIIFYAVDKVQDMILEIESFKIYEVR